MPRLMSVSLTEDAVRRREKTVTRRLGWRHLKPGERLTLCQKVMGRKPGEPIVRLVDVEVVSTRRERLDAITDDEVEREGFPGRDAAWFLAFFTEHMRCQPDTEVTRIQWRYLTPDEAAATAPGRPSTPSRGPR